MKKLSFLILGIIFLVLAYIGILLPGIPAIPFILLSGWFFLKSSDKLYAWMLRRRFIGPVLEKFYSSEKTSNGMKWFVISQLWVSVIVAHLVFPLATLGLVLLYSAGIISSIIIYKLIS